jgi:nucleotide-binding universal stress UspA family protein
MSEHQRRSEPGRGVRLVLPDSCPSGTGNAGEATVPDQVGGRTMATNNHLEINREKTCESVFSRVLVGVDGSEAGFEACRQASRLADAGTPIELVDVVDLADAIWTGYNALPVTNQLRQAAETALEQAVQLIGERAYPRFVNGTETAALLQEIKRTAATLIAVGSHGHHRVTEILIGGVAGSCCTAHPAPFSSPDPRTTPRRFPAQSSSDSMDRLPPNTRWTPPSCSPGVFRSLCA